MKKNGLVGKKAPELVLPNSDGQEFKFNPGSTGRPTALFFYPESGTYGCTREACQFRDALAEEGVFRTTGVDIIGISPDPVEKQKKFVEKQKLTYPILSDKEGSARKAYNVNRGLLGLTASSRVTFLIDKDGHIVDALDNTLNYSAHHKFVENWLKALEAGKQTAPTTSDPEPTSVGEGESQPSTALENDASLSAPAMPAMPAAETQGPEAAPAVAVPPSQVQA